MPNVQVGVKQDMEGFLQHFLQASLLAQIILLTPPTALWGDAIIIFSYIHLADKEIQTWPFAQDFIGRKWYTQNLNPDS